MKPLFSALFLLIFSQITPLAQAQAIACHVVGISDGDTLTCLQHHILLKVRLQYIDAPEYAQPYGNKAKQALSRLAFRKNVTLDITGRDRYQRLLAVVFDEQGRNLNLALVEQGMAWAYRQSQPVYERAMARAKSQKIGLWQDKRPINPSQWRKKPPSKRSFFS